MANAASHITRGALKSIFSDAEKAGRELPVIVLQCLQLKPMIQQQGGGGERYRLILSDTINFCQCMLATQTNHVVHDGKLVKGSIVRVKSYNPTRVKDKDVLIILDLEVIESLGTPDKLGDPVSFGSKAGEPADNTIAGTGFYGTKQEDTKPAPAPRREMQATRGGGSHNSNNVIYPIEALSPYAHKWTIKARVSAKSDIKTWHKNTGEGKLFSVNLLDESGEIKATAFNDQVDQFHDLLQEGQVYYISNPCSIRLAKKQFSNLPNDYELTFERDTVIEKAEDQSNVPQVRFNFCGIQALNDVEKDTTVDVIGVLKEAQEVSQITSKTTQKPYDKRELTIVDDSGYSVRVTIWGKTATNFDARTESVIAFKGVRVSDFGGRSLSLLSSGTMAVDPDIPECHKLKGWYDASGRNDNFATHNMSSMGNAAGRKDEDKNIFQVKDQNLGMEDTAYFTLKATVVYIKQENFAYAACLTQGCNKKVDNSSGEGWRCEKCNVTHDRPEYRYIMSVNVNDHTGQLWLSCFDDVGRVIMGRSADELMALRDEDETQFAAEFEAANCKKLSFRCRAKMDTFQDTPRVRYQVMSAGPLDYVAEAKKLTEMIKQYEMI
ncbi:replication factor-a protein [Cryphonectria parasitica EP155]|uniref:Replication protein A subunit n=1 Tax=Cryphonectria parasitica (strain ATCC 38755 / EP155) TaxID=660469 RepID=A0A9P4XUT1_CRYP1|nr:replication factor-a protein [Cryphonectria parasitica EP155]KAF3761125.1 replication factor-a protein [Cryphonectria parasitica EP155]